MTTRHRAARAELAEKKAAQGQLLTGRLNAALDRMEAAQEAAATAESISDYWAAVRDYRAAEHAAHDIRQRAAANKAARRAAQ